MKTYNNNIIIGKNKNKTIKITKEYVTQVDFICGIRGTGKSYAAGLIEEQMNKSEWPFIIIDPLGIHKSLRDKYNNVVIIGGEDGDSERMRYISRCIANGINCVVDLSEYEVNEQQILCKEVCEIIKDEICGPLKVIIEECDIFIPQRGGSKECKEIITYLVRKERMHGLGMTLICQRFASVSKDVVTQVDNYFVFRSKFNSDIVELKKLFSKEVVEEIKMLSKGCCYVDSEYYEGFMKFGERECMHLGGTPVLGESVGEFIPCGLSEDVSYVIDYANEEVGIVDRIKSIFS